MTFTKHLINERFDRINFIINRVGFGKVIKESFREKYGRIERCCITDTGVMMIKDKQEDIVITMWIATLGQIEQAYKDEVIPHFLVEKALDNRIYQRLQHEI